MLYSQDAARMSSFFNTLTQTERYVLLMFYADELTPQEIGMVLELPEPKVTSMLRRLRGQAMALLEADKPGTTQPLAKSA